MSTLPPWASRGVRTGLVLSAPVPLTLLLVAIFPDLKFGSVLALLPLLAVGPLAVRRLPLPLALPALVVAGVVSAIVASVSLTTGLVLLGPAGLLAPPLDGSLPLLPAPRLGILPSTIIALGPLDFLVLQPLVSLGLGLLSVVPHMADGQWSTVRTLVTPRSARRAITVTVTIMTMVAIPVGWLGFAALEEHYVRENLLTVHQDWKAQLREVQASFNAEQAALARGRDDVVQVEAIRKAVRALGAGMAGGSASVSPETVLMVRDTYQPALKLFAAAYEAHRIRPDNGNAQRAAQSALVLLRKQVDDNVVQLATPDAGETRQMLRLLAILVAGAGIVGFLLHGWMVAVVDQPLRQSVTRLLRAVRSSDPEKRSRTATGDLLQMVEVADEIGAELERLYAIEDDVLTAAERKSIQDKLLTRTATALVAATDLDKIFQIAVRSATALARQPGQVRASIAIGPLNRMAVVAAHGEDANQAMGARMNFRDVLDGSSLELQQHRFTAAEVGITNAIAMLGFRPRLGTVLLTTLRMRHGKLTMIVLESDDTISEECAEGVAKLGADVALALDSAAFREDQLVQRSEARFRSLVQNSTDVTMIVQPDGIIQYQSASGERVLGYGDSALIGTKLVDLIHPDDAPKLGAFMDEVQGDSEETTPRVEWRLRHADGSWVHTETTGNNLLADPHVAGLVFNSRDVGDRLALQEQLAYQAFHDPLTTLPNRALFMDRLEHALLRASRRGQNLAILFLDLDNFKIVNDSLGHQAGDHLLIEAAQRLLECVRTEDTVARLGGDEFTILMEDIQGLDSAEEVAKRIAFKLRLPFSVFGHEVFSTASVGIALSGPGALSAADLLRNADLAMYRAKGEGRARYVIFDREMNIQAMKRLELETALRRAVERRELRLVYQPIMSLESMGIDRVETLVRWQHPERGLVSPADFIPVAEETGLIVPIGQWVLREACRQARIWQREFPSAPNLVMSVNLSPRQFQHPSLLDDITHILIETGLDPERLELEITEGAVMADADGARELMVKLRDIGISLAIDDFGTGYSSLGYLKRFPVSVLKIDQSFVRGLGQDDQDSAIVRGVIALAQSLNLTVTAEGIETLEQLARLRDLGCNHGQGYLLSRPLSGEALGTLLARSTVQLPSPKHGLLRDHRAAS